MDLGPIQMPDYIVITGKNILLVMYSFDWLFSILQIIISARSYRVEIPIGILFSHHRKSRGRKILRLMLLMLGYN